MSVDFKYLHFSPVYHQNATTLTEAIKTEPVSNGFVFLSFKIDKDKTTEATFVKTLKEYLSTFKNKDIQSIKIYRQLKANELGGIVPFDQEICEKYLDAKLNLNFIIRILHKIHTIRDLFFKNELIDIGVWIMCTQHDTASTISDFFEKNEDPAWQTLLKNTKKNAIGAFKNMARYSQVSDDANKIQFFNLFPAPGKLEIIWNSWLKALPWFFEIADVKSSFPLLALNKVQKILLINAAHFDSAKNFIIGVNYDPVFKKIMSQDYRKNKVSLPYPFFCKIVAVL